MIKKVATLLLLSVFIVSNTFAHVMNSDSVFTDISYSEAKDEIVLLSSLGVVSYQYEEYIYRPQEPLTRQELASWVGAYYGLKGETSEQLANLALTAGYISSLNGMATYADVNQAYFHGYLELDEPDATMTREQFAQFVVEHAETDLDGHNIYDMSGFTAGPIGTIEAVKQVEKLTPEGKGKKVYELTIGGRIYELGLHPRVIAQVTDPAVWVGMSVTKSWIGPNVDTDAAGAHGGHAHESDDSANHSHHDGDSHEHSEAGTAISEIALQFIQFGDEDNTLTNEVSKSKIAAEEIEPTNDSNYSIGILLIIVVLAGGFILVFMRKKQHS